LFSFSNQENETNRIIENFEQLLIQEQVFDKRWGFVRKKVENTEHSFYLGGSKMQLPKRQISFDNEAPPTEIVNELQGDKVETEVQDWCNSADIFLLCIDLNNKPETEHIARLTWRIKQTDREKTILYAVTNCKKQDEFLTFDEYVKFSVDINKKLNNNYLPYTDSTEFVKKQKEKFSICKELFCFTNDTDTQIDCLFFCINQLYKDIAEIRITDNKAYNYLTTNINFKNNSIMKEKSIKIAVVGAADNGKSHFISDVFRALNLMGIDYDTKAYLNYAQIVHYLNDIVGKKGIINPTNPMNRTRNKHHYKGYLNKLDRDIEFMDIPGEAFMNAEDIFSKYQMLKDAVKKCYTYGIWKRIWIQIFGKKKNTFFVEEYRTSGKTESIKLALNNNRSEQNTIQRSSSTIADDDKSVKPTIETAKGEKPNSKPDRIKYVSGEYVVNHFEKYETENLKDVLKQIVTEQENNPSFSNLKNINSDFWNNFYSYAFCDSCDDIILCELLAVSNDIATKTVEKSTGKKENEESDFFTCLNGIKTFFSDNKKPRMYVIFKGLDAMLNQEEDTFKNLFGGKVGADIAKISPQIYLLIHLAIYKKFFTQVAGVRKNIDAWIDESLKNKDKGFLNQGGDIQYLLDDKGELKVSLDEILLDESEFKLPRDTKKQGIESHLGARILEVLNFGKNPDRFKPAADQNEEDAIPNFILPHIYFTAYPIDAINLTIHKNSNEDHRKFDGLNVSQRLPLGTFNFIADLLNANGNADYNNQSDLENLLYYKR
jgi:hypothetical protein